MAERTNPARLERRSTMVLHYQDDGPSGPCGQDTRTTSPWSRLYRYEHEGDATAFMRYLKNGGQVGRRNPRIVNWWFVEDDVFDGPIVPEAERV